MLIKYMQLARNIRTIREERGYSMRDVARKTHMPLETIEELEANRLKPTVEQLISLSLALEVSVDTLLDDVY